MRNYISLLVGTIVLFIILALGAFGIYQLFPKQITQEEASPTPQASPSGKFPLSSPGGSTSPSSIPEVLPAAGTGDDSIHIFIENPKPSDLISSPVSITGLTDISGSKIEIKVKDANGQILGHGQATACMDVKPCSFKTTISFEKPATLVGTLEVYSSSPKDGSPEYLQTATIRFD